MTHQSIRDLLNEEGGVVLKSQPKHDNATGATTVAGLSEHPVGDPLRRIVGFLSDRWPY